MNNYHKGKNVEEPLDRKTIPITGLPENFLWMQVRGGSKIRNLLTHALNEFPEVKHILWTGFGPSVGKAVTCAEIMKRECDYKLHQITKICYRIIEEFWDPIHPELCQLVVKRKLPMIHIYLSAESLDKNDLGYQAPGQRVPYRQNETASSSKNTVRNFNLNKGPTLDDFVSHKLKSPDNAKTFKNKKYERRRDARQVSEVPELAGGDIDLGNHLKVPNEEQTEKTSLKVTVGEMASSKTQNGNSTDQVLHTNTSVTKDARSQTPSDDSLPGERRQSKNNFQISTNSNRKSNSSYRDSSGSNSDLSKNDMR